MAHNFMLGTPGFLGALAHGRRVVFLGPDMDASSSSSSVSGDDRTSSRRR